VIIPFLERTGQLRTWDVLLSTLLISPPILALLVVLIERTGPLKNWTVSFLVFFFFPALVLNHDCRVLLNYVKSGSHPMLGATLLFNAVAIAYALAYAVKIVPRPCPGCQRRTLLPLMQLFRKEVRSSRTYWCASCGAKFWKDANRNWRPEKRKTWLEG